MTPNNAVEATGYRRLPAGVLREMRPEAPVAKMHTL